MRFAPKVLVSTMSAPGAHVLLVHLCHQIGLRDVQRVEALVDEHALRIQHRAHGAVADEHALTERVKSVIDIESLVMGIDSINDQLPDTNVHRSGVQSFA